MPLALLLLLTVSATPHYIAPIKPAAERAVADSIFRYVSLGSLGRIELGRPLGNLSRLAVLTGPHQYRLQNGTFGGAKSIVITTDEGGIVRRIGFEYGVDYGWEDMLADYKLSLGLPSETSDSKAIWNDGRTEFLLSRTRGASYVARAEMRDLTP